MPTVKSLLGHILLAIAALLILCFIFFFVYLPYSTNKDQIVSVPNITGLSLAEAIKLLEEENLNYEASSDSGYAAEKPALVVLDQLPKPLSKVKINRSVTLTLNARKAPLLPFPAIEGTTLEYGQNLLKEHGFIISSIAYRPDLAHLTILEVRLNNEKIKNDQKIPKGAALKLIVASTPEGEFPMPDLKGLSFQETENQVGLILTLKTHDSDTVLGDKIIMEQSPPPGRNVKKHDLVDIWISK